MRRARNSNPFKNMPNEPETEPAKAKRSQTKRELHAVGELIRVLKPYTPEDRKRLLETASYMMGGN